MIKDVQYLKNKHFSRFWQLLKNFIIDHKQLISDIWYIWIVVWKLSPSSIHAQLKPSNVASENYISISSLAINSPYSTAISVTIIENFEVSLLSTKKHPEYRVPIHTINGGRNYKSKVYNVMKKLDTSFFIVNFQIAIYCYSWT